MSIGKAILRVRLSQGLTQAQVGTRARLATSYLSRLENGHVEPTMGTLQRIADALAVPVSKIFSVEENQQEVAVHPCPVSTTGLCIGQLMRSRFGRKPQDHTDPYGPDEIRLLRMTDYLIQHASPDIRSALATILESLLEHEKRHEKG